MAGKVYNWPVERIRALIEDDKLQLYKVSELIPCNIKTLYIICKRHGIKTQRTGPRSGPLHPDWKGGVHIDKDGYRLIYTPGHPFCRHPVPYVREHRLVMEKHLGRYLGPQEVVHHRNGVKLDNRIENLELFQRNGLHLAQELKGRCPKWSEAGRARILFAVKQKRKAYIRVKSKPSATSKPQ